MPASKGTKGRSPGWSRAAFPRRWGRSGASAFNGDDGGVRRLGCRQRLDARRSRRSAAAIVSVALPAFSPSGFFCPDDLSCGDWPGSQKGAPTARSCAAARAAPQVRHASGVARACPTRPSPSTPAGWPSRFTGLPRSVPSPFARFVPSDQKPVSCAHVNQRRGTRGRTLRTKRKTRKTAMEVVASRLKTHTNRAGLPPATSTEKSSKQHRYLELGTSAAPANNTWAAVEVHTPGATS